MPGVGSRLEFRILGPLEVSLDERALQLGAYRQRALLAALLLRANEVVSTDRLIEDVWGEPAPPSAPNMIQVYVSRLRKALGRDLLLTRPPGYLVLVEDAQVDAARFARVVARARDALAEGEAAEARTMLEEAMALWRGAPLADFIYEPFAQPEVARLEELRLEAIELRADADLALGRHARLVGELEPLIAAHPFRERLRGQLMLALYRSGRQAEALEAYRSARATLVDELGIEPSPALQALERAILAQDDQLLAPTETPTPVDRGGGTVARTGNLPAELTSLIGRDRDIERIADLVDKHRLTAVVGPGGVGKTRVALRIATTVADSFEHGVWFVDLGALEVGGDVTGAVQSAVGIFDRPGAAALDTVADELHERRLLLVLDNCEHVLGAAAEVTERLLADCPRVRVLATSREPLAIAGERVTRLEPLPAVAAGSKPPAAVELFLDRAATHGVSLRESAEVLGAIGEVCVRLDGLPLAIELAAARTRAISPAGLLVHLDDRMRLLTRPGRQSGPTRQQTLEAAIAWSYDLLDSAERATLRRLSVFHGGFSLAAAGAVCADVGSQLDTLDRITTLADRSVVNVERRTDGERYRLLESIGLFGEQRLREKQEAAPTRDRHARFFLDRVREASDELRGPGQTAWGAKIDAEQDNLTAALRWCLEDDGDPNVGAEVTAALGLHWIVCGRSNTARHWLERAVRVGADIRAPTRLAVHVAYAILSISQGEIDMACGYASQAVAIGRELRDDELLAEALAQLAAAELTRGNERQATAVAAELRSLQPRLRTPLGRVMSLLGSAQVAIASGHPDLARSDTSQAYDIAQEACDHLHAAMSGYWLAYALALTSEIPAARRVAVDAASDAHRSGYQMLIVDNLCAQTSLALADDDEEMAWRLIPRTVEMLHEQQRWVDVGSRLHLAAGIQLRRGHPEQSALLLGAGGRWTDRLDYQDELLLPEFVDVGHQATALLGAESFERAFRRGAALSLDDVVGLLESPAPLRLTS